MLLALRFEAGDSFAAVVRWKREGRWGREFGSCQTSLVLACCFAWSSVAVHVVSLSREQHHRAPFVPCLVCASARTDNKIPLGRKCSGQESANREEVTLACHLQPTTKKSCDKWSDRQTAGSVLGVRAWVWFAYRLIKLVVGITIRFCDVDRNYGICGIHSVCLIIGVTVIYIN